MRLTVLCVAVVSLTRTAAPCTDDNTYFNTDYHPVPGPGYVADTDECDDGALHAGVGLWDLREMVRRSSVLQHTLGRRVTSLMFHVRMHHSVRLCVVVAQLCGVVVRTRVWFVGRNAWLPFGSWHA